MTRTRSRTDTLAHTKGEGHAAQKQLLHHPAGFRTPGAGHRARTHTTPTRGWRPLQVSDNAHKHMIEPSPKDARTHIYFRNVIARQQAESHLLEVMRASPLQIEDPQILQAYLPTLLPVLQELVVEPTWEIQREA